MRPGKKKHLKKAAAKMLFAGVLSFGLTSAAFAQLPPPPKAPPAPPSPAKLWKKINPFKKNKHGSTAIKTPPPPPDPIKAIKKIKIPPPPKPPGL